MFTGTSKTHDLSVHYVGIGTLNTFVLELGTLLYMLAQFRTPAVHSYVILYWCICLSLLTVTPIYSNNKFIECTILIL